VSDYIYCISYLIIMNFVAAVVTILDKHRAKRHLWRVSENKLLLLALLGGSPAMLLTMLFIHHKTRHVKFMVGIPVIFFLQMCIFLKFMI
jgi:uncharacterized membrane protein YsdA (DUF1294 family)